ncbi:uncharacterized protein [Amphiura filiformis]|uniref:uncharacterized protein n=1 Tax=Amphiura filiformis TaxID=82378 RepID=UPI003B21BBF0
MIKSAAIICLFLSVALCPDLVSAQRRTDWNRTDLSDAALVGIIIGVIFFVIIVIALIFMCLCFLGNCWRSNDYYYEQPYYYPEAPLPPPCRAPEPAQPLAVVVAKPEKESRPVFVVQQESVPSPQSRRAFLVRTEREFSQYDPYDSYDERGFRPRVQRASYY